MIQKIRLVGLNNDDYPIDKLNKYENKLNKWVKEFENDSKVKKLYNKVNFVIFIY